MASPAPSEEERRLLREYRLISVPSRRSSLSPATSSVASGANSESAATSISTNTSVAAGSGSSSGSGSHTRSSKKSCGSERCSEISTIINGSKISAGSQSTNNLDLNHTNGGSVVDCKIIKKTTISPVISSFNRVDRHNFDQKNPQQQLQVEIQTQTLSTPMHSHGSSTSTSTSSSKHHHDNQINHHKDKANHRHHHHRSHCGRYHHHHHHHHHSSNHRRHKNSAPRLELTSDELSRMLELASGMSYLELVSPKNLPQQTKFTGTITPKVEIKSEDTQNNIDKNGNRLNHQPAGVVTTNGNGRGVMKLTNGSGNNDFNLRSNAKSNVPASDDTPYMFEKVDYIKRFNLRRKAFRKLKNTKCHH